jgi:hypothetical protein
VGLRLIFLTVSSVMSLFRLSRREEWWKDAEILVLCHQLAVALRERPANHQRLHAAGDCADQPCNRIFERHRADIFYYSNAKLTGDRRVAQREPH